MVEEEIEEFEPSIIHEQKSIWTIFLLFCCYCQWNEKNKENTSLIQENNNSSSIKNNNKNNNNNNNNNNNQHEQLKNDDDDEDDGIQYDGELEIHHSPTPRSNVSKLYSSLLQSHYDNHINVPTVELVEQKSSISSSDTLSHTNNPIHNLTQQLSTTNSSTTPTVITTKDDNNNNNNSNSISSPSPSPSKTSTLSTPRSPSPTLQSKNNEYSSISTLSPSENPPTKRGLSTTARFQRFVTSKMAATTSGQELMTQALNEEGQMIVNWLISAVKKYSGETKSNEIMEHFLKLLSKIAIFYNDQQITETEISQFKSSLMPIFTSIYICLNCTTVSQLGGINKLIEQINKFYDVNKVLVNNLMSEKNSKRFLDIITYFKQKEFLVAVFTSNDFLENRNELKYIIKLLTE